VLFDVAFTLVRRALAREQLTAPHRGHLYQVAHRAGVPATGVTLMHWGFTAFGGGCALLFLVVPSEDKPYVPLLTLLPQLLWLAFVAHLARAAGMRRWG
jgi:UDP-GlcNAc:undecaprenyl-phosphate GlcNAc-1-phosphate transferase